MWWGSTTGVRMKYWGKLGAFWSLVGECVWLGLFVIPGFGQLVVLGPLAMMIVGALEGALLTGGLAASAQDFIASESPRTASSSSDRTEVG